MNGDEARIARKLQIGFDKGGAHGDRFPESGQRVFRRITRGTAVRDDQHGDTEARAEIPLERGTRDWQKSFAGKSCEERIFFTLSSDSPDETGTALAAT